jgi:hypothetical protein
MSVRAVFSSVRTQRKSAKQHVQPEESRRSHGGDARDLASRPAAGSFQKTGRIRAERPLDQRPAKLMKQPAPSVGCTGLRLDPFHTKNAARPATPSSARYLQTGDTVVCKIHVSALKVRQQSRQWPEKQECEVKWMSPGQAAKAVKIRRFARVTTP